MTVNITRWQHEVNSEEDKVSTLTLSRRTSYNPSTLAINIKQKTYPQTDYIFLQLFNNRSHAIFQSLFRASQCCSFACPDDVLVRSLATVTVYGVKTLVTDTGVSYHILMGGKVTLNITGGLITGHATVYIQPMETYLDLLADATNKLPYPVDVVGVGPYRYMLTDLNPGGERSDSVIIFLQQRHPSAASIMFKHGSKGTYEIPFDLKPATEYKLQLFRINTSHVMDDVYVENPHSNVTTFTTHMTQDEVRELFIKAVRFVANKPPCYLDISHFYRNKSEEYFNNIMTTDGVMHRYDKNWGGDQASTLNKQVQGLFFSTTVDRVTHLPPDFSYFGPVRLHVPTYLLLNNNINMYFSDFYCHRVNHKVQFVLSVKGSPTDHFCRQRLVPVDQTNNPFLMRVRCGFTEIVRVTKNVTVEVFYTEDVPVKVMLNHENVYFTKTKQIGNALSMINGIPKNKNCRICNLDCFLLAHNML